MPKPSKKSTKGRKFFFGFTIIELLVVIATMVLVFTAGFANYRGAQKKQQLSNATLSIKSDLRKIQEFALSNKAKPAGCDVLNGYKFQYINNTTYKIYANCNVGATKTDIAMDTNSINLADKFPNVTYSVSPDNFVNFLTLGRGVESAETITVTSSVGSQTITVSLGGQVN